MLRVDPRARTRIAQIIADLNDRIEEARGNGWLGRVQGLWTSRNAAAAKLASLDRTIRATADRPADLGTSAPQCGNDPNDWVDRGASAATGRRRRAEGRRRPAALTPTVSVVASRCMFLKSLRPSAPLRTDLPHRGRYRWRTDHECGRASLQPCRPAMGLASVPRDGRGRQ